MIDIRLSNKAKAFLTYYALSGGSRGGAGEAHHPSPWLILGETGEITEGRNIGRARKIKLGLLLSSMSGSTTGPLINSYVYKGNQTRQKPVSTKKKNWMSSNEDFCEMAASPQKQMQSPSLSVGLRVVWPLRHCHEHSFKVKTERM